MNNKPELEAEAGLTSSLRPPIARSRTSRSLLGEEAAYIIGGGVIPHPDADEVTPLISRDHEAPPNYAGTPSAEAGGEAEPEWPGMKDFEGLPWWKKPSIYWLLPFFLLFTLAFGGALVPKLNLIKQLACRDYYAELAMSPTGKYSLPRALGVDDEYDPCREDPIQRKAAKLQVGFSLVVGLLSAIVTPMVGALSDRYGRKKILGLTACGSLLGEIFSLVGAIHPDSFNVHWFFLSFALDGLTGSFTAGMALGHAYASDCTPPAKRNVAFGYFHGCLFIGIALGPIIGGLLVQATGSQKIVFISALIFHLVFVFAMLFIIPESLSKKRQLEARKRHQQEKELRRSDRLDWLRQANLFEPLKVLWPTGPGSTPALRRNLVLLAAADTIMFGAAIGSTTVIVYYLNREFGWHDLQQSVYVSTVNIFRVLTLFLVLPIINRVFRRHDSAQAHRVLKGCDKVDVGIIRFATLIDMVGHLGYALVRTGPLFVVSGCIAAFSGMGSPTLSSSMTKHVPNYKIGQLLGASGLLHALARVVAPPLFNAIWFATIGKFTQTIFVFQTSIFGIAAIAAWFVKRDVLPEHDPTILEDDQEGEES